MTLKRPMTAAHWRIENIETATSYGHRAKVFTAYVRQGDTFIYCGRFSAPLRTANRDLWKYASDQPGEDAPTNLDLTGAP
jgi:hypothetical protein